MRQAFPAARYGVLAVGVALACAWILGAAGASLVSPAACASWPPYAAERIEIYGNYTVCVWKSLDPEAPDVYRVVTIDRGETRLVCQDWATGLGLLSGADIECSGYPNVIVERYSGGAHCCFATDVYDLAEALVVVELPPSPGGNVAGRFVDLDADGIFEYLSADDSFAYAYCAFAGSAAVPVVLAYDTARHRYVPASSGYPQVYAGAIERDTERARAASLGASDVGWDGTAKCGVLPLVLDYLYSGDPNEAWGALELYYPFSDRDEFRAEIETLVSRSPYFAGD
jgi:hypothetical protein